MEDTNLTKRAPIAPDSNQQVEKKIKNLKKLHTCPYASSIKRYLLDFDYEKFCSISLSKNNVYACLVCGKYYQGKGMNTHVYFHALEHSHHLFINLLDCKVYCVPDNYEFDHPMLADIKVGMLHLRIV